MKKKVKKFEATPISQYKTYPINNENLLHYKIPDDNFVLRPKDLWSQNSHLSES